MPKYINADELIADLQDRYKSYSLDDELNQKLEVAYWIARVDNLDAADVRENVRGEWRKVADKTEHITYECVFCGAKVHVARNVVTPNFCNRCGAGQEIHSRRCATERAWRVERTCDRRVFYSRR